MLKVSHLYKSYNKKDVLKDINLEFDNKGLVVILGKSGSGKTTLLNILSGYDSIDDGDVFVDNKSIKEFNEKDFNNYRKNYISYIFQDSYLLEELSINENLSMILNGDNNDNLLINKALEKVGLEDIGHKICKDLSGGQKQRVNIARTLVKNNKIIFADEPTGALDSKNSEEIFSILKTVSKDKLVVVVTHNKDLAYKFADRIVEIKDGSIFNDITRKDAPKNVKLTDNVVLVEQGSKLEKKDLDLMINKKSGYIGISDNLDKLAIIDPSLLDVENHSETIFKSTELNIVNNDEYKLVENKLSNKQIYKLSKNSKTHKTKYNLLFVFLTLFATFLIISINLSFLSLPSYVANRDSSNLIKVSKITNRVNEDGLNQINEIMGDDLGYSIDYKLTPVFAKLDIDSNLASEGFNGIIENGNLGYSLLCGNDNYKSNYEIVITDYMASLFLEYGVLTRENVYYASNYQDLLDKEIYIEETGEYYKIIGIYKTDYFSLLEKSLLNANKDQSEIINNIEFIYSKIFARKDFYKQYKLDYKNLYFYQDNEIFGINLISDNKERRFYFSDTRLLLNKDKVQDTNFYSLNGEISELPVVLKDNEVIISIECIYEMFKESDVSIETILLREDILNVINNDELKMNIIKNNEYGEDIKILNNIDVKIVGILDKGNRVFLSSDIYKYIEDNLNGYDSVYVNQENANGLKNKLDDLYDAGYYFGTNSFKCENAIEFLKSIAIIKNVFTTLSIVLFIFAFLLSFNYLIVISKSRKKELALYRSYGTSKWDIYKIFGVENIKLSIKVIVISSIGAFIVSKLLNSVLNALDSLKNYASNLINISFFNVFIIFIIIVSMLLIISYLVLRKIVNTSALKLLKEE